MINPAHVIKLLQEKDGFGNRHPRFTGYMGELLRGNLAVGDTITVTYTSVDGTQNSCDLEISPEDVRLLNAAGVIFK